MPDCFDWWTLTTQISHGLLLLLIGLLGWRTWQNGRELRHLKRLMGHRFQELDELARQVHATRHTPPHP
jgi:hypothetical protein